MREVDILPLLLPKEHPGNTSNRVNRSTESFNTDNDDEFSGYWKTNCLPNAGIDGSTDFVNCDIWCAKF